MIEDMLRTKLLQPTFSIPQELNSWLRIKYTEIKCPYSYNSLIDDKSFLTYSEAKKDAIQFYLKWKNSMQTNDKPNNFQAFDCYAVTIQAEDGYTIVDSYWTSTQLAKQRTESLSIKGRDGHIVPRKIFKNKDRFYEIKADEVFLDLPTKEEVLRKLTPNEKKVLGV